MILHVVSQLFMGLQSRHLLLSLSVHDHDVLGLSRGNRRLEIFEVHACFPAHTRSHAEVFALLLLDLLLFWLLRRGHET